MSMHQRAQTALAVPGVTAWSWAVAGAALVVFWNSMECGFCLDDHLAIDDNEDVTGDVPIADVLRHDFWGRSLNAENSHKSWRPITTLTFKMNHVLGGTPSPFSGHIQEDGVLARHVDSSSDGAAWHYHATNIILHAVASALCVQLASVVNPGRPGAAGAAGMLFAVHPVHVEAVTGVVGRADELATIFCILAFICYNNVLIASGVRIQPGTTGSTGVRNAITWYGLFLLCASLGMLSKEVAITVLGVVLAFDIASHQWICWCIPIPIAMLRSNIRIFDRREPSALAGFVVRLVGIVCCAALYLGMRSMLTSESGTQTLEGSQLLRRTENPFAITVGWSRLMSLAYLQAYYGFLLLCPYYLCCEYSYNCIPVVESWNDCRNVSSLLFWSAIALLIFWAFHRHRQFCHKVSGTQHLRVLAAEWTTIAEKHSVECSAIYSFTPQQDGDTRIRKGEPVFVARKLSGGWWEGWNATGQYGRFPRDYVASAKGSATIETQVDKECEDIHDGKGSCDGSFWMAVAAWMVLPMVPATNVFFTVGTLVAERLLYMPSLGFAILVAHLLTPEYEKAKHNDATQTEPHRFRNRGLVFAGPCTTFVVVCVASVRTQNRTYDWINDETLYTSAVQICPNSAKNHHQLGQIYDISGRMDEALEEYMEAKKIDPDFCDVDHNLGQHYLRNCQQIIFKNAEESRPDRPKKLSDCTDLQVGIDYLRSNVDCIFSNMKSYPLLMQVYQIILADDPQNATLYGELGSVFEQIGNDDSAAQQYSSQGQALLRQHSYKMAAAAFERAVDISPHKCEYIYWLADARHTRWVGLDAEDKRKSQRILELACANMEEVLNCLAAHRTEAGSYKADLGGDQPATEISEANFMPSLLLWRNEQLEWYGMR